MENLNPGINRFGSCIPSNRQIFWRMIILHAVIVLLFIVAAFVQLQHESIIYKQKDNKNGYAKLEDKRKDWRIALCMCFFAIGAISAAIILLNKLINTLPPLVLGAALFWILFDGLYAKKVRKQSFWYVGITNQIDRFLKTPGRSRLFKLGILGVAILFEIVNLAWWQ